MRRGYGRPWRAPGVPRALPPSQRPGERLRTTVGQRAFHVTTCAPLRGACVESTCKAFSLRGVLLAGAALSLLSAIGAVAGTVPWLRSAMQASRGLRRNVRCGDRPGGLSPRRAPSPGHGHPPMQGVCQPTVAASGQASGRGASTRSARGCTSARSGVWVMISPSAVTGRGRRVRTSIRRWSRSRSRPGCGSRLRRRAGSTSSRRHHGCGARL